MALSYNAWLETEELSGLSSSSSLHYVFEHINTCFLLVQPMKIHPDITENILTGTLRIKSSKQTFSSKNSKNVQSVYLFTNWSFWQALIIFFIAQRLWVWCAKFTCILVLLALIIGPEWTKLPSLFPFTGHSTSYEYRYYFVQCVDSTETVSK